MSIIDTIDNALDDWQTSADAMRWTPDAEHARPTMPRPTVAMVARFVVDMEPFRRAMEQIAKTIAETAERLRPWLEKFAHELPEHDKTRCARCSPQANPPTLCIDGREYHRRRKGRRR